MFRVLHCKRHARIHKHIPHQLIQQREFVPLLIGGLAILAVGTVARYVIRTKIRLEEEEERARALNPDDDGIANVNSLAKILEVKSIGVDIGSVNCRLAIRNGDKTDVLENSSGQFGMPSVMINTADGVVVGSIAKQKQHLKSGSVLSTFHILSGLPPSDPFAIQALEKYQLAPEQVSNTLEVSFKSSGESFSASQMRTLLSKELYSTAAAKDLEAALLPAILTVPNYFSDEQKVAAVESAKVGGLNIIYAIPDAVSSLLGMHDRGLCDLVGTYVVVDVGGRLTQLAVIECKNEDEEPTVVATRSILSGGDCINDTLAKYISEKFEADHRIDLMKDNMAKQRLYDAVESLKVDLSSALSSSMNVPYITADSTGQPKHLELDVSRSTFENLIESHTQVFESPLQDMLSETGIHDFPSQISGLLVVGGGSRVPIIHQSIVKKFGDGVAVIHEKDPEVINVVGTAQYPKYY